MILCPVIRGQIHRQSTSTGCYAGQPLDHHGGAITANRGSPHPVDPFSVDRRRIMKCAAPTYQYPDPAIAIAGKLADIPLDFLNQSTVLGRSGLAANTPILRPSQTHGPIRTRHTEGFTDAFYRDSPGNEGERTIHFLSW